MKSLFAAALLAGILLSVSTSAQENRRPQPPPQFVSPEQSADRKVTFRIHAPQAEKVTLSAGDIPGLGQGANLAKGTNGVWETTVGPVRPGSFRYTFNVDGIAVMDPRNPLVSESNNSPWSLIHLPGEDFMDTKPVPHGAVSEVTYYSTALKRFRRMHVYTPPGYESGKGKYPVFYLLHGAFDCDDSWSTVGRAGFILDNLIAEKKAKPMVVVMPAGHTAPFSFGAGGGLPRFSEDPFVQDFNTDIMPYVEKTYRVRTDRASRAIAGLSMGGWHTLNIATPNLSKFAYIGVYSSGVFGINGRGPGGNAATGPTWEESNQAALSDAKAKKGLKLLWFGTGKEDFLLETTRGTVALFKKHGFEVAYDETEGGHTWIVWREYLRDFAPKLFN